MKGRYNFWHIPFFDKWLGFSGAIPEIYWNVYSDEQRYKFLCCRLQKLVEYAQQMGIQINLQGEAINELKDMFDKFMESGFDDYYRDQIEQWIKDNLAELWKMFAAQVFFGLTSDGYFCAYVPNSWISDIEFDTGMIYGQFDYGRLILRYNVEGSGVIDNTGRYDELNTNLLKVMGTLYSPMREGDL